MLIAIIGPTATGKSELSLDLAQLLALRGTHSEIIGADAMQFYRHMDIGTAKLSPAQRRAIPHHQIDILNLTDEASVAAYQRSARTDIENILEQGKAALVVGGSGLYVSALLDKIEFPGTNPTVRSHIEARLEKLGPGDLHRELSEKDPIAATKIDAANTRRVVRALEVIAITGKPFSASMPRHKYVRPTLQLGLKVDTEILDQRIFNRTKKIFADGLVEETRELIKIGLKEGKTASRATGYAQAIAVIEGQMTPEEAIEAVALATRQLARKQMKWFRRDQRIIWLNANGGPSDQLALEAEEHVQRFRDQESQIG